MFSNFKGQIVVTPFIVIPFSVIRNITHVHFKGYVKLCHTGAEFPRTPAAVLMQCC